MADKKKVTKKAGGARAEGASGAAKSDAKDTGKKIIAVLGATGAQGGGLVRAILNDKNGGFAARALTRDPSSEKANALAMIIDIVTYGTGTKRAVSSTRQRAVIFHQSGGRPAHRGIKRRFPRMPQEPPPSPAGTRGTAGR